MSKYRRITYDQRCHIAAFLQVGMSFTEIALRLKVHKSTISREVKRGKNQVTKNYTSKLAEEKSYQRRKRCRKRKVITTELLASITDKLEKGWSPRQIHLRYKLEGEYMASTQTIYNYIKSSRSELRKHLRMYKKTGAGRALQRRRIYSLSANHISQRSPSANNRKRIGDWERDTFYIKNRHQILVLTDRKTRFTLLEYVGNPNSEVIKEKTKQALKRLGKKVFTMTNDNDSSFKKIEGEDFKKYQCTPRKPQERGTVENTIGLIRQYIKRTTEPEAISSKKLRDIEKRLNHRPKMVLDYKTPHEAMHKLNVAMAT